MGEMRYRKLGKWGLKVSEISLGAWVTFGDVVKDKETVREIVGIAYEGGVNFFDNADVYAKGLAEEIMGRSSRSSPGTPWSSPPRPTGPCPRTRTTGA